MCIGTFTNEMMWIMIWIMWNQVVVPFYQITVTEATVRCDYADTYSIEVFENNLYLARIKG